MLPLNFDLIKHQPGYFLTAPFNLREDVENIQRGVVYKFGGGCRPYSPILGECRWNSNNLTGSLLEFIEFIENEPKWGEFPPFPLNMASLKTKFAIC